MVLQERQCQRWRPLQVGALLKSVYTDLSNPASFSSPNGLYKAAKKINPNITFRDVEFWLETQLVYTLYRKSKNTFKRHKVLSRGIGYQYQADLVDYSALKRDNSGFTFVLTVIDVFSHIALALPIKSKRGPKVAAALEKAFCALKSPKRLQINLGKEFDNKHVQDLLKKIKFIIFQLINP